MRTVDVASVGLHELRWLYLSISKQVHKFLYVHIDCEAIIAKFLGTLDSILYSYGLSTMFSAQQHGIPMKYLIMVLKLMQVTGCKLMSVIEKLNKKRKLAKNHQAFLASESVIKQIPPLVGPGLNKTGNFPTLVSHQVSLEAKVNETKATVKFLLWKFKGTLAHPLLDQEDYEYDEEEEGVQSAEHLKNRSSFSQHQPRYFQPPKIEGEFDVSDLVCGKVRSHPWWPGQIVDPSDAS
ncbi:60S ribosomal protein L10a-1 [Tanacetum coccineum]